MTFCPYCGKAVYVNILYLVQVD